MSKEDIERKNENERLNKLSTESSVLFTKVF